ncbi:MAG: hypothetical protein P8Y60_18935, partial [Calditrichota bacterium]
LRGWPGFSKHYRDAVKDTSKFQFIKIAAVPHFRGSKPAAVLGGWNLMISKHSSRNGMPLNLFVSPWKKRIKKCSIWKADILR